MGHADTCIATVGTSERTGYVSKLAHISFSLRKRTKCSCVVFNPNLSVYVIM